MCKMFATQDTEDYEYVTRSVRLNGQSTSIRLERAFWDMIDTIAAREGTSTPQFLSTLHGEVLVHRGEASNFTSLLRCACLKQVQTFAAPGRGAPAVVTG